MRQLTKVGGLIRADWKKGGNESCTVLYAILLSAQQLNDERLTANRNPSLEGRDFGINTRRRGEEVKQVVLYVSGRNILIIFFLLGLKDAQA